MAQHPNVHHSWEVCLSVVAEAQCVKTDLHMPVLNVFCIELHYIVLITAKGLCQHHDEFSR